MNTSNSPFTAARQFLIMALGLVGLVIFVNAEVHASTLLLQLGYLP